MSELLSKVAELLNAPESLVQRSAEARAEASGRTVDEVLQSWAGGEAVASSEKPAEEAPPKEEPEAPPVEETEALVEQKDEVENPKEDDTEIVKEQTENIPAISSKENIKKVIHKVSFANKTLDIKVNAEASLPRWLNFSFVLIPLFIVIGIINTSSTQECGENGILDVDRKTQLTVNCDGTAFEGKGVGSASSINYIALGQQVYSGAAACAGCHGVNGGGGVGPAFTGGELYTTFPTCSDHALWIELGSAGWQAEVGPAYGAENKVSIGGMPGFTGKLTEDEIYAVVVFERVVFGGGNTDEVLEDCGLLETDEEVTTEAVEPTG